MRNRILTATAVGAAGTLLSAGVAVATSSEGAGDGALVNAQSVHGHQHAQHGADTGHLPATRSGVLKLVSKTTLKNVVPEKIADVGVLGTTAYLAAWGVTTCDYNGVHVVDIKDVTQPREIGFIRSKTGSYPGEGIQALPISTPAFTGDILVSNNEKCSEPQGFGGLNIYDVTNPAHPTPLVEGYGDATVNGQGKKDANEIHSVFAWDAGDKAYAVVVDNEEAADVDIIDITDPRKPALVAEYDLAQRFPQILQTATVPSLGEVFLHDMVVKQIGGRFEMLLSYWDGGYVRLDVTDPRAPRYLGDTDYPQVDQEGAESGLLDDTGRPVVPEGNGHQAEYTKDNKFILATDEDFSAYKGVSRDVTKGVAITAGTGSDTTAVEPGDVLEGQAVFVGRACGAGSVVAAPATTPLSGAQIAVVERGVCTFTEKVSEVVAAGGYEGILIVNRTGSGGCNDSLGMSVEGTLPTFGVAPREQGLAVFDAQDGYDDDVCRADTTLQQFPVAVGTLGDVLSFGSYYDGWGYVRAFKNHSGKMTETDTYAVPEAHDRRYASGFGDLSVHEVAMSQVDPRTAYIAYYSAGVRAVSLSETGQIRETGAFIDAGGSNFWGIEVFQSGGKEYVAGSDRDHGLYIFEASGKR